MSANVYWRPRVKGRKIVHTDAPSSFIETLELLTSVRPPLVLDRGHLPALRAIAKVAPAAGCWPQLIKAIEEHDEIEITAEW